MFKNVCSTVHNTPELEGIQIPTNRRINKQYIHMVGYYIIGYRCNNMGEFTNIILGKISQTQKSTYWKII